jgi:hypothetical protein
MVEQSRSCIELIFCGLHHLDLVLEKDEVLDFVSPDIFGVEWLDQTTRVTCTRIHQCTFTTWLPTSRRWIIKQLKRRKTLRRNP